MKKMIGVLCSLLIICPILAPALQTERDCEVYFSPKDGVAERLIGRIQAEKESIRVAVYCLMHAGIARALSEAHARGVDVEVIVDPYSINSRSPIAKMVEKGVSVYVWNPKELAVQSGKKRNKRKPLMHDKFCVFGNHTVWTGSFNFTRVGNLSNRENVIVLGGSDVADSFLKEFQAIKEAGCSSYASFSSKEGDVKK